jgi:predicted RNA methylase
MDSLFGIDLYQTPKEVIEKMLFGVNLIDKVILEPGAGLGAIVEFCQQEGAKEVIACEISPRLRKILSSKCHIIENDFLELTSDKISHVDLIIMNPPFMADEKHILHAYDIAPAGCQIISLCNESLIKNAYSSARKQVKELAEHYGRSESFGDCFSTAERKTNVNVSCIWIHKPGQNENEFEGFFDLHDYEQDEVNQSGIVRYDFIQDVVSRYVESVKMYDNVEETNKRISKSIEGVTDRFSIVFGSFYKDSHRHGEITRQVFKKELQKAAWNNIFGKMNMHKYVTQGVLANINKFVEQQIHVPFSVRNVYKMIQLIAGTHGQRMDQVLVEAFEKICSFSADNNTAGEKWRTNSDYMVNRKFIKPYVCEYDTRWPSNYVTLNIRRSDSLDDIVKALCYLTGTSYEDHIPLAQYFNYSHALRNKSGKILSGFEYCFRTYEEAERKKSYIKDGHELEIVKTSAYWGEWADWGFFRVKGFKKKTMHFEFKDEKVWELFNRRVAEIKGWNLPRSTRKAYQKKEGVVIY